jgi:hypothetical protein
MLALMRKNEIVQTVGEGSFFEFTDDTGSILRTSPAIAGWERYGLKLVTIIEEMTPPDGYFLEQDDLGRPISTLIVEKGIPIKRGVFSVIPPKYATIDAALLEMSLWVDKAINDTIGNVSVAERDSWESKKIAARAYLDNTASDLQKQMLEIESRITNENVKDLCQKIADRAERYTLLVATIAGIRRRMETELSAASVNDYPKILEASKIAIMDEAAMLGYELKLQ